MRYTHNTGVVRLSPIVNLSTIESSTSPCIQVFEMHLKAFSGINHWTRFQTADSLCPCHVYTCALIIDSVLLRGATTCSFVNVSVFNNVAYCVVIYLLLEVTGDAWVILVQCSVGSAYLCKALVFKWGAVVQWLEHQTLI